ncbi:MAG: hypothetical protein ACI350_09395, partial [Prevotella sp.]
MNYRLNFASLKILPGFSEVSGSVFRFSIPPFPNPVFQPVSPESATAMDIPSRAHEKNTGKELKKYNRRFVFPAFSSLQEV